MTLNKLHVLSLCLNYLRPVNKAHCSDIVIACLNKILRFFSCLQYYSIFHELLFCNFNDHSSNFTCRFVLLFLYFYYQNKETSLIQVPLFKYRILLRCPNYCHLHLSIILKLSIWICDFVKTCVSKTLQSFLYPHHRHN